MKTLGLLALLSVVTFAADYRTMTMEEMQAMRGSVPVEERAAFQNEMQTRTQSMNQEQHQVMQRNMIQNQSSFQNSSRLQMGKGGGMRH